MAARRLVLVTDVTEQKKLEEQLIQAQKMEAIGQLAGGIAHDFNNLLTAINGYAQIVINRLREPDPLRQEVGHILHAGERAAVLTQQLLAFSRRQVLQPRALSVRGAIETLRPMLGRLLREDIEIRTTLPPDLPPVMVDPVQFEQVVINLSINASDAMPAGGVLSIDAATHVADEHSAQVHNLRTGQYVTVSVSVSDTGTGMDAATSSRIFEPFFTTKPKGRGSGLGLSVAYGIVQQSGGHLSVYTEPGRGSTFTAYFPVTSGEISVLHPAAPFDATAWRGTETVLIGEDHDALRRLAGEVLRTHGDTVLAAEHGQEALTLAEQHDWRIDLLLTTSSCHA